MPERVVLIIQARMNTRLPGKSMMPLAGKPLVAQILERVQRCKLPDEIVLAFLIIRKIKSLVNSENLVASACLQALRIICWTAISGCVEPCGGRCSSYPPIMAHRTEEIDRIVEFHLALERRGFGSNLANVRGSGYPDGIETEVFDTSLQSEALAKAPDPSVFVSMST